jgi:hypothetical protein
VVAAGGAPAGRMVLLAAVVPALRIDPVVVGPSVLSLLIGVSAGLILRRTVLTMAP